MKNLYYVVKPVFHENCSKFWRVSSSGAKHEVFKNRAIFPSGVKIDFFVFAKKNGMLLHAKTYHFGKFVRLPYDFGFRKINTNPNPSQIRFLKERQLISHVYKKKCVFCSFFEQNLQKNHQTKTQKMRKKMTSKICAKFSIQNLRKKKRHPKSAQNLT